MECSVGDFWCLYWGDAYQPGYCSGEASYVRRLRDLNFMYPGLIVSKLLAAFFESLLSSAPVKGTGVDSKLITPNQVRLSFMTPDFVSDALLVDCLCTIRSLRWILGTMGLPIFMFASTVLFLIEQDEGRDKFGQAGGES